MLRCLILSVRLFQIGNWWFLLYYGKALWSLEVWVQVLQWISVTLVQPISSLMSYLLLLPLSTEIESSSTMFGWIRVIKRTLEIKNSINPKIDRNTIILELLSSLVMTKSSLSISSSSSISLSTNTRKKDWPTLSLLSLPSSKWSTLMLRFFDLSYNLLLTCSFSKSFDYVFKKFWDCCHFCGSSHTIRYKSTNPINTTYVTCHFNYLPKTYVIFKSTYS